jgi:FkbM family methyltransferase
MRLSSFLVIFYKFWHGRLHLPGAGFLLNAVARFFPSLQTYPLAVDGFGIIPVDFSDVSGFAWLNFSLSEKGQEAGLIRFLKNRSGRLNCIWDVGANAGYFAAEILQEFPHLPSLYLFEPNPRMRKTLLAIAHSFSQVRVETLALSDNAGEARFSFAPGSSTLTTSSRQLSDSFFAAETYTGDNFFARNPASRPDGIIIDVEGSEPEVIRGLQNILTSLRPWIVFEQLFFNPACLDCLMPPGYQRFTIHDSSGELSIAGDSRQGRNGVFLPI